VATLLTQFLRVFVIVEFNGVESGPLRADAVQVRACVADLVNDSRC
jgi:hypothetical protein